MTVMPLNIPSRTHPQQEKIMKNSFIWEVGGWFLFGTIVLNCAVLVAPYATKNDTVKIVTQQLTVCPSPAKVNALDTKTGKIRLYVYDKCQVLQEKVSKNA